MSLFPLILVLAYFGPETTLPLASVLAAAVGCMLMFCRVAAFRVRSILHPRRQQEPEREHASSGP